MNRPSTQQTIYAVSTPPGRGGIGVVRISGSGAKQALCALLRRKTFLPRRMVYAAAYGPGGELLDRVMAVFFPGPESYTGEDMGEIHAHGNPVILEGIMAAVAAFVPGARPAQPGEYTKRAYLNGKMDLTAAEAVMEAISAQSRGAAAASMRHLSGETGAVFRGIREGIKHAAAGLEAAIDYPEEEWEEGAVLEAMDRVRAARGELDRLTESYRSGRLIREGVCCTIVGRPNVGKSSILNAAAGFERAIVDEAPGTTRDVLEYPFTHRGQLIRLRDTAGRREAGSGPEAAGLRLGEAAVAQADVVLLVLDGAMPLGEGDAGAIALCAGRPAVAAINKGDLPAVLTPEAVAAALEPGTPVLTLSARTGEGITELMDAVLRRAGLEEGEAAVITSARQRDCLARARAALDRALSAHGAGVPYDMVSMDVMDALSALMELTGEDARAAVIDAIFADFCVGK